MIIPLDLWMRVKRVAREKKLSFKKALSFLLEKGLDPSTTK